MNLKGRVLNLERPVVMGILNVTPDSFYDGGKYLTNKAIIERAHQILEEGGTIVDVGGYSSRPGALDISLEEELNRVIPAIRLIAENCPEAIISIDSFRTEVVRQAVGEGACLINDISGGALDPLMFQTVAELNVPYILMHMKGTPQTMVKEAVYENMMEEIIDYFSSRIQLLREAGVKDIILDPGIGFAKTPELNFQLLNKLKMLGIFNLPIMIGVSRKSMIYKRLDITQEKSLNGTTVLNTISLMNGASILRVHDVRECVEAVKLFKLVYP